MRCFQTKMLSQNVSPLHILMCESWRGAQEWGEDALGGGCVVLCCVVCEGRGGEGREGELSSCWAEGSVGCVYAHTSLVLRLVQGQRHRRRSLVPDTLSDGGDQVGSTLPLFPSVMLAR